MNDRKCPECGAAFTPQSKTQVCCSKECQKKRHRRYCAAYRKSKQNALKRNPRDFEAALKATTLVTLEVLMRARRKPRNCSAVRWRIELRRRQNPGYYALLNEL
jgi:hypothetical protein